MGILRVTLWDSDARTGQFDLPIENFALPTDYIADHVLPLLVPFGGTTAAFLTTATVKKYELIYSSADALNAVPASSDIRNNWKFYLASVPLSANPFTLSIPGRNTLGTLTTGDSKGTLIDRTQAAYTSFVTGVGAANGIDPRDDGALGVQGAKAAVSPRTAPRI